MKRKNLRILRPKKEIFMIRSYLETVLSQNLHQEIVENPEKHPTIPRTPRTHIEMPDPNMIILNNNQIKSKREIERSNLQEKTKEPHLIIKKENLGEKMLALVLHLILRDHLNLMMLTPIRNLEMRTEKDQLKEHRLEAIDTLFLEEVMIVKLEMKPENRVREKEKVKEKVTEDPFQAPDQKATMLLQTIMSENQFPVLTNKIKLNHKKVLRPTNKNTKLSLNLHQVKNQVMQRKHLINLPNQRINRPTATK